MSYACLAGSIASSKLSTLVTGYAAWYDASDISSLTYAYAQDGTSTVSGTQGTNIINVIGGSISNKIFPNGQFQAGTDVYTVASINSNIITTVEPLVQNYSSGQHFNLNFCTQQNDKSGNGYNITQPTSSIQPVLNINQKNGLAALGFAAGFRFVMPAGLLSAISSTPCTIFAVAQSTAGTARQTIIQAKPTSGTQRFSIEMNGTAGSNTAGFACGSPVSTEASSGTITPNNTNIYIGSRSGTTQSIQVNNAAPNSNTNGADFTYTSGFVGVNTAGASGFAGLFYEMVIYPSLLTSGQIAQNLRYFNNKWSAY